MVREQVLAAAQGCAVIVHAVNPPGYRNWSKLVLPMVDNTIAAAQAQGATIVLPGTVYNFGPDTFPVLREASPQNQPANAQGRDPRRDGASATGGHRRRPGARHRRARRRFFRTA